jgi:hypothetical protein
VVTAISPSSGAAVRSDEGVSGGSGERSIGIPQEMEPEVPERGLDDTLPAVTVADLRAPATAGEGLELVDLIRLRLHRARQALLAATQASNDGLGRGPRLGVLALRGVLARLQGLLRRAAVGHAATEAVRGRQ